jgi:hypothetical protein
MDAYRINNLVARLCREKMLSRLDKRNVHAAATFDSRRGHLAIEAHVFRRPAFAHLTISCATVPRAERTIQVPPIPRIDPNSRPYNIRRMKRQP